MDANRSSRRAAPPVGLALALILAAPAASAQQGQGEGRPAPSPPRPAVAVQSSAASSRDHAAAPVAQAVRITERIAVDGRLDEAVWMSAPPITQFIQLDPDEGTPVSERTEVRFLYDDEALYVGAWLWDEGEILDRLARRDAMVPDADFFVVTFDSYHDHRTAYRFATSPSAMKRDEIMTNGGGGGGPGGGGFGGGFGDTSWDPVYELDATVTEEGWFVEYRIPFSQLRFSPAEEQTWGLQVERKIRRKQENTIWAFTPKDEAGGIPAFGHLAGLRGIRPGRRLEVLPYVGGRAEYLRVGQSEEVSFGNPFRSGSDYFASAGVDLKYRVTSNLTLDATVNPDFGQVEVDPAVINLTAFETRFEERRPFFVEGAEIFRFGEGGGGGRGGPGGGGPGGGGAQILYTRRIGRAPQGDVPDAAVYQATPSATTILGAAKLTGKTANGWSLGLMNAVTNREKALWVDGSGNELDHEVEPWTNYLVSRVRRELRNGQTGFGLLLTAVNRDLNGSPLERLRTSAYSGGVDFRHEWADREWEFQAQFSPSYISGGPAALVSAQRSSSRYYQRPDADYLRVDSSATSLAGFSARAAVQKQAGDWRGMLGVSTISPGYEVNDLGFQTAADRVGMGMNLGYDQNRPGRYLRRWSVRAGHGMQWNYGGNLVGGNTAIFSNGQFANYWEFGGRIGYSHETLNDRLTRGGPLARDLTGYQANLNIASDNRGRVYGRGGMQMGWDEGGAWRRGVDLQLTMRPSNTVEIAVGPDVNWSRVPAQYLKTVVDPTATHTYGRRYVFANLDQTTVGIDTRVNVTFTPNLSFELYAQPYLSSGDYRGIKELAAPRTFDFLEYGAAAGTISGKPGSFTVDPDGAGPARSFSVDNRNFNYRSLRGNAVFRWEWSPGSTLFLVWQQNRAAEIAAADLTSPDVHVGNFDFGRDARELFGLPAENVFLIKLNYWLNPSETPGWHYGGRCRGWAPAPPFRGSRRRPSTTVPGSGTAGSHRGASRAGHLTTPSPSAPPPWRRINPEPPAAPIPAAGTPPGPVWEWEVGITDHGRFVERCPGRARGD